MRRVLAALSNNMSTGDITTLANPDVVEKVRELAQGKEAVALADGPEDLKKSGRRSEKLAFDPGSRLHCENQMLWIEIIHRK